MNILQDATPSWCNDRAVVTETELQLFRIFWLKILHFPEIAFREQKLDGITFYVRSDEPSALFTRNPCFCVPELHLQFAHQSVPCSSLVIKVSRTDNLPTFCMKIQRALRWTRTALAWSKATYRITAKTFSVMTLVWVSKYRSDGKQKQGSPSSRRFCMTCTLWGSSMWAVVVMRKSWVVQ